MTEVHILNLGAGVQSTDLALEFDAGEILDKFGNPIKLKAAFFADTQDEPAAVYRHLEWIMRTVKNYPIYVRTKGKLSDDLVSGVNSTGQRFAPIPAFTFDGQKIGQVQRQCSKEYKIEVIDQATRREILGLKPKRGVPAGMRVVQYLGISFDEVGRAVRVMRNRVPKKYREQAKRWDYARLQGFFATRRWAFGFPLIEKFKTRTNCLEYLATRVPHQTPRSACIECPYHDDFEWAHIREVPEEWARAVEIDHSLRKPGNIVNRNINAPMYLHRSCVPLDLVQLDLTPNARKAQLSINFAAECMGVCGV